MWWNFLNDLNIWGLIAYIGIPVGIGILTVIGLISIIRWIF